MTPSEKDSWIEYRKALLDFCENTKEDLEDIQERLRNIELEMAGMRMRFSIIAAIVGFVASSIPIIIQLLIRFVL